MTMFHDMLLGGQGFNTHWLAAKMAEPTRICPCGDPYCPCQDGDACHYRAIAGTPAMLPPKSWPNFGTIPAPVPNPYTQISPAPAGIDGAKAEHTAAVHRAVEVLKAKS